MDDLGPDARADSTKLGDLAAAAGLSRVHFLAWRDLDDPEAGGSELHAHEVARRWAAAGIEVTFRTSFARRPFPGRVARRVPRDPQGGPLPRVPPGRVQRDDGLARRARRPRRDLERHALLLAGVGDGPAHRVPPPRARRDVGHGARRRASPSSAARSSRASRRRSTGARGSSRCRSRRSASSSTSSGSAKRASTWSSPGIDPQFSPGGAPDARAAASSRSAVSCPVKRFHLLVDAIVALRAASPGASAR